jgi:hypothetical protein
MKHANNVAALSAVSLSLPNNPQMIIDYLYYRIMHAGGLCNIMNIRNQAKAVTANLPQHSALPLDTAASNRQVQMANYVRVMRQLMLLFTRLYNCM